MMGLLISNESLFLESENFKIGKSLIEENSGSIISNVSQKLNYLIAGVKPTKKKIETAKKLNIKILKQQELLKMLNKTS